MMGDVEPHLNVTFELGLAPDRNAEVVYEVGRTDGEVRYRALLGARFTATCEVTPNFVVVVWGGEEKADEREPALSEGNAVLSPRIYARDAVLNVRSVERLPADDGTSVKVEPFSEALRLCVWIAGVREPILHDIHWEPGRDSAPLEEFGLTERFTHALGRVPVPGTVLEIGTDMPGWENVPARVSVL